jgi:hypothetical protein
MTLDEILKAIDNLSDEDKAKVGEKMKDLYKAEDEREIDKIEEDKADDSEIKDEKEESVDEESKEIGKTVDEIKEEVAEDTDEEKTEEVAEEEKEEGTESVEETLDEGEKTVTEEATDENLSNMVHGMADRLAEIEAQLSSVLEIKAKLEEIAQKKDKAFGYEGKAPGPKKDYSSMTADELKNSIAVKI